MCNFLSVLILKNGDIRHHPMLDSHSDLVAYFNLPDKSNHIRYFAKAELTPDESTWLEPDKWTWRIDEETRPGWLDDVESQAEASTRALAQRMVLTDPKTAPRLIVDGVWIVGGKNVLRDVRGGRIIRVQDSAQIHGVRGSAQIHGVGDSAQIHDVRDSAQIHGVRGSAQIHGVWGSAQIHDVRDSAQIHGVRGSAQLDESAKAHVVE